MVSDPVHARMICSLTLASQIGTHADSMIASAISRNVTGWNRTLALEAVLKNANVAPELDMTTQ